MTCPAGKHEVAPGALSCSRCGTRVSPLGAGEALPYPHWRLAAATQLAETPLSVTVLAQDELTGRRYEVREYVPAPRAARRELAAHAFIRAARSLRALPLSANRVPFAYTRQGRCYAVTEAASGTPLLSAAQPGSVTQADAFGWLTGLLRSLSSLHAFQGSAGALFHGGLTPKDVLVTNQHAAPGREPTIEVHRSLYLENLLSESPLSSEQGQRLDVLAAAQIVSFLVTGSSDPNALRPVGASVAGVSAPDLLLLSAVDYLLRPVSGMTPSAAEALRFLALLRQASENGDPDLWRQAYEISRQSRLQQLATPLPTPPTEPPVVKVPSPPTPPPLPVTPPSPPPSAPPIAPQVPPWQPVAAKLAPPRGKRRRGCLGGCLTLVLALILIAFGIFAYSCAPGRPASRSISFTLAPNPVRRGRRVTMHWQVTGYSTVTINGAAQGLDGTETFVARNSATFTLRAEGKGLEPERRDINLIVEGTTTPRTQMIAPKADPESSSSEEAAQTSSPAIADTGRQLSPDMFASQPATDRRGEDESGVQTALARWTAAIRANDAEAQADCYAPVLDRYFLKQGVDHAYVRAYLAHEPAQVVRFNISRPKITPISGEQMRLDFNKTFAVLLPNGQVHEGEARSELHMKQVQGEWKITFERDFIL